MKTKYEVEIEHYLIDGYKQTIEEYGGKRMLKIEATSNFTYKGKTYACAKSSTVTVGDNSVAYLRNKLINSIRDLLLNELIVIESGLKNVTEIPLLMQEDYNKLESRVIENILKEVK